MFQYLKSCEIYKEAVFKPNCLLVKFIFVFISRKKSIVFPSCWFVPISLNILYQHMANVETKFTLHFFLKKNI